MLRQDYPFFQLVILQHYLPWFGAFGPSESRLGQTFTGVKIVKGRIPTGRRLVRLLSMMLTVALVAGILQLQGMAPMPKAEAAAACDEGVAAYSDYGPGGVTCGLISWLDMNKGYTVSGTTITRINDQVEYYYQNNAADNPNVWTPYNSGRVNLLPGQINYHNAAQFVGAHFIRRQFLDSNGTGEVFSVVKSGGYGFPLDFGGTYNNAAVYRGNTINTYFGRSGSMVTLSDIPYDLGEASIMNAWSAPNNWGLALNGDLLAQLDTNTTNFTPTYPALRSFYIGAMNGRIFERGELSENITYNRTLSNSERNRINSYLALKYGLTLRDENGGSTDYIASDESAFWAANDNIGYGNRITGIGRDDQGMQNQKQSKSQLDGANLAVGLGADIPGTNSANTGTIEADKSFFVFSDDNGAAAYTAALAKPGESLKRMERTYKVDKTNWTDANMTFLADQAAGITGGPTYLVVSSDAVFDGSDTFIPMDAAGKVMVNSSVLADGSYFTFAAAVSQPVALEADDAADTLTLTFTREVAAGGLAGFTVLVNGVPVTPSAISSDPSNSRKLVLALAAGAYQAGDGASVTYDGSGSVTDRLNGLKVADFSIGFVDKAALQAEADLAATLNREDYSAASWNSYEGELANARTVLGNVHATQDEVDAAWQALEAARMALTADYSELQSTVDEIEASNPIEADYTPESWQPFIAAKTAAEDVLNNPASTQREIDEANKALKDAYGNLVTIEAILDRLDLSVANSETNEAIDLTPTFDGNKYLNYTAYVGDNVSSVAVDLELQSEGSSASITFRGTAYPDQADWNDLPLQPGGNVLEVVVTIGGQTNKYTVMIIKTDKTLLQAKADAVGNLTGERYTQDSWIKLREALDAAHIVLSNPNTNQVQVDAALQALDEAHTALAFKNELVSLVPSYGNLRPDFDSVLESYALTVPNNVYELTFTPTANAPDAVVHLRVDEGAYSEVVSGTASQTIPLRVGRTVVTVRVTGADGESKEYVITVTRDAADNGGGTTPSDPGPVPGPVPGPGNGPVTGIGTKPGSGVTTTVDGKDFSFADGDTATDSGGTRTTVRVDRDKLSDILSEGEGQRLAIRVPADGETAVQGLTAADVQRLAETGATLEIEDLLAIYPVPSRQLDLDAIARQWDAPPLEEIALEIHIQRSPQELADSARKQAEAEGYELLVPPVDLDLTFSHDGDTVRAGMLNEFAVRYIALPKDIDPGKITTGVVVNPDGTMFHVPTVVTEINNRYFAQINDLRSHGTYSVIWNPQDFDDVKTHWGRTDVNNIAARLDLAGTGDNKFSPDRGVTRSELSEIVVLGLGLMRQDAPYNGFPDVPSSAWYRDSVAIAAEFDIVRGYNDGNFYGDQLITREQGIAMIARAYNLVDPQAALSEDQIASALANYKDAASVSAWARAEVAVMVQAGIVEGDGPSLLSPQSSMTRVEVTALVARLLKTTGLIDQ